MIADLHLLVSCATLAEQFFEDEVPHGAAIHPHRADTPATCYRTCRTARLDSLNSDLRRGCSTRCSIPTMVSSSEAAAASAVLGARSVNSFAPAR